MVLLINMNLLNGNKMDNKSNITSRSLHNISTLTAVIFALVLIVSWMVPSTRADSINPNAYSIDSKPYGLTYGQWTAKWEQWLISMPQQVSAATDSSGKNCAQNQTGPVWFLAGTVGGTAERTCTIPAAKAILFPIVNSECSYAEYPTVKTESDLVACAKQDNNRATNLLATVDGQSLQPLEKYRVTSPLFNFTFEPNNLFGAPSGPTQGVSDGFWVFLQPLSSGNHEIHFSSFTPSPSPGASPFVIDVTYHLTVH
jgi:hypothetical protein